MNLLEPIGVATGAVAVWLTTRQHIWCWPIGIVSVSVFILVFYEARLYAAMGLQAVYVALAVYGWHAWLHGGEGGAELPVSRIPRARLPVACLAGVAGAAALGWSLARHTDARLPWLDASLTSFSLVAQFMQARKWIENWVLWVAIDIAYVAMYVSQDLALTAGLYFIYLALAVVGWTAWRKSLVVR